MDKSKSTEEQPVKRRGSQERRRAYRSRRLRGRVKSILHDSFYARYDEPTEFFLAELQGLMGKCWPEEMAQMAKNAEAKRKLAQQKRGRYEP